MEKMPKEDLFWGEENRTEKETLYYFERGYKGIDQSSIDSKFSRSSINELLKRKKLDEEAYA